MCYQPETQPHQLRVDFLLFSPKLNRSTGLNVFRWGLSFKFINNSHSYTNTPFKQPYVGVSSSTGSGVFRSVYRNVTVGSGCSSNAGSEDGFAEKVP